jgi:hypothetical protein
MIYPSKNDRDSGGVVPAKFRLADWTPNSILRQRQSLRKCSPGIAAIQGK